jgi:hypothetical protein
MTAEVIVDAICKVLQSKTAMTFDDKMTVYFTRIKRPAGSGRMQRKYVTNMEEYLKKKKAIIQIINDDDLCCARAIVTAKARIEQDRYEIVRLGDRNRHTLQRDRARALMTQAGLANHKGPCGRDEWTALQSALGYGRYQLKIFDKDTFSSLIYQGSPATKILHLWLCHNHFHVITSPAAFFETSYFCNSCNKAYKRPIDHRVCAANCHACFARGKCIAQFPLINCDKCMRFFNNRQCLENHLRSRENKNNKRQSIPICKQLRRCETCRKEYRTRKGHKCGVRECPICKVDIEGDNHQCFIQPYHAKGGDGNDDPLADSCELPSDGDENQSDEEGPSKKKRKVEQRTTFVFYDFECRQDEAVAQNENSGDINLHLPNLVVAHKVGTCTILYSRQSHLEVPFVL